MKLKKNKSKELNFFNVINDGRLIEYEEWERLPEEQQDNYLTYDDFNDSDYIMLNGVNVVSFIEYDNKVFYWLNCDYEDLEDEIIQIIELFFRDDFKKYFREVDFAYLNSINKYKDVQENNIMLFYRGGVGYSYGVHILRNNVANSILKDKKIKELITKI